MTGGDAFSTLDHLQTLSEERRDGKKARNIAYESILKGLVSNLKGTNKRLLLSAKCTGDWLSVCNTTVSGTVLSATEFRDFLCARYNVSPVNLQSHCDGCGTAFVVKNALILIIGVLVIARHNKICNELLYIS